MVTNYLSYQKKFLIASLLAITLFSGCIQPDESVDEYTLPDHINNLENLTVYPPNLQPPDTVLLTRETVFESSEEILIEGYIMGFAVDNSGRVFVGSSGPGTSGVYLFDPDGTYLSKVGRQGYGPGEFERIKSLGISNEKLYLYDPGLQKISVYSIDKLDLLDEILVDQVNIPESDKLLYRLRIHDLKLLNDERMLVRMQMLTLYEDEDISKIRIYELTKDGTFTGPILELDRFSLYFPAHDRAVVAFPMPFSRGSLTDVTRDGFLYTAWTEDFLIKVYDSVGTYKRAFYHPVENSSLSMNRLQVPPARQRVLNRYELPDTWPALHTMFLDDENRLWVATITDSESSFLWWVLTSEGDLIARFEMPGERASRSVMIIPLMKIRDGYFYIREQDLREGIDRIVKYRIDIVEK